VSFDPGVVDAVFIALMIGLQVLSGVIVVVLVRRRHGLETRRDAIATLLVAGLVGWGVVLVILSEAYSGPGEQVPMMQVLFAFPLFVVVPLVAVFLVSPGPPVPGAKEYLARMDEERGAATVEYVGMIVVAAVLVASVLIVFSSSRGWIPERLKYAICQVVTFGQGGCQDPGTSAGPNPHKPTQACMRSDLADLREGNVSVMNIGLRNEGTVRVQEMSDGSYTVSAQGVGGVGLTPKGGASASLEWGGRTLDSETIQEMTGGASTPGKHRMPAPKDPMSGVKNGVQWDASVFVDGTAGLSWKLNEGDKDKLVSYLKTERNLLSAGPYVGTAAMSVKGWWDKAFHRYEPPAPTDYYIKAGTKGNLRATSDMGLASVSASVEAAAVIGGRVNAKTGAVTIDYAVEVTAQAAADLGLTVAKAEASASGTVRVNLAVTSNRAGDPILVVAQGQAVGDASAKVTDLFGGGGAGPSVNGGRLFTASVSLNPAEVNTIASDLMHAVGIPTTGGGAVTQGQGGYAALGTFVQASKDHGALTVQDLATDAATSLDAQLSSGGGYEVAAGVKNSTEATKMSNPRFLDKGIWNPWPECGS
jgi:Flp pilus assembly pilin Flp